MKERRAKEQSRRYESPYWVSNEGGNAVGTPASNASVPGTRGTES